MTFGLSRIVRVLFAITFVMLAFFLFVSWRTTFDSDSATKSVLAGEILRTGTLFPHDFRFVGDLWLLHGHLPLLVLIPMFGSTYFVNALSSLIFAVVFLFCADRLLRRCDVQATGRVMALLLLCTGFSPMWVNHVFAQASYGYVTLVLLLALWVLSRAIQAGPLRRLDFGLLLLMGVVIGLYGGRAVITYVVPLAAGVYWAAIRTPEGVPVRRVFLAIAGLVVGYGIRRLIISGIHLSGFAGELGDLFWFPTTAPLGGLLNAFEVIPWTPVSLRNPWAVVYPVRLAALIGVLALSVAGSRRADTPGRRLLVGCHWTLFATTLYFSMTVQQLAGVGRYLIPPLITAILVGSFAVESIVVERMRREIAAGIAGALLLLSAYAYVWPSPGPAPYRATLDDVAQWLEAHHVEQAYATFWNAASTTVLSGGDVKVRQIEFRAGLPMPYRHLSSDTWYCCTSARPTALVVAPSEEPLVAWNQLAQQIGRPSGFARVDGYLIAVYPQNRFPALKLWQDEAHALSARTPPD